MSDATNLVPGDTNNATDVFRADLTTGKIVRVSVAASGAQANKATAGIAMNATGSSIAFASDATNLVPGDTNARADIFLRDLATTAPKKLSNGWRPFPSPSGSPTISPDGRWVGFLGSPEAGDGPVEGVAWSRATGKSTRVCLGQSEAGTDTCDDLAASKLEQLARQVGRPIGGAANVAYFLGDVARDRGVGLEQLAVADDGGEQLSLIHI